MWLLAGLNAAVFAATLTASMFGADLISGLALPAAAAESGQYLSYMFTHSGLLHILINMLILVAYGTLAATLGLGGAVAPLYLAGGLAGAAAFTQLAPEGAMLTGASASILALVAAMTVWCGSIRVAIPWAGRPHLRNVSILVTGIAVCSTLATGQYGALAAHAGGLAAGSIAALTFSRQGRGKVSAWLNTRREHDETRRRALDKARFSGYNALTETEKEVL